MKRLTSSLILILASSAAAATASPSRTIIIVDASSSMRLTDPRNLRRTAAELYVDLAAPGERISILEFDTTARPRTQGFVEVSDKASREALKSAIRAIGSNGQWTDFYAAFQEASATFSDKPTEGERRTIIFLTDGMCDPSPEDRRFLQKNERLGALAALTKPEREARCQALVTAEIAERLKGVSVISVGLSAAAPKEFLQSIAKQSNGRSLVTENAAELPRMFAEIYAYNSGAQMIEPKGLTLDVDAVASTLDVVLTSGGDKADLINPEFGSFVEGDGNYLVRAQGYTLFHVRKPATGLWTLRAPAAPPPGSIVAIQAFDLHLTLKSPTEVVVGNRFPIELTLETGVGGSGLPKEFLARHRYMVDVKSEGKAMESVELPTNTNGAGVGGAVAGQPGVLTVTPRLEPGKNGTLALRAPAREISVYPPLAFSNPPTLTVSEIKPGEAVKLKLDLAGLNSPDKELVFKLTSMNIPLNFSPANITVDKDRRSFELTAKAWDDAPNGPFNGSLALEPATEPFVSSEALRVAVNGSVNAPSSSFMVAVVLGFCAIGAVLIFLRLRRKS